MNKEKNMQDRLPLGKFFAWKSRDISLGAINTIILGYITIFCTDYMNMAPSLVAGILLVSKLFDGVTDLFAGYIVDNTHTKLGKARPYEIAILFEWLFTILLFSTSAEWSTTLKTVWVFTLYTLVFSVCNTLLNGNQTPYLIRAFSNNQTVITKVASYGGILSMFTSVIVSMTFPILMKHMVGQTGWTPLICIYGIPLALIGILRFIFVKEDPSIDEGNTKKVSFHEIFQMLKINKYVWVFAGIMGIHSFITGMSVGSYYFTYVIGDIGKFSIVSALTIVLLPVMFGFPKLMKKYDVAWLFAVFGIISALGYVLVFFGNNSLVVVIIGVAFGSLINLPSSYLQPLVIMELSTYNENHGLPRMEGSSNIVSGFAVKVGSGIGSAAVLMLLGLAGYVQSSGGDAVQPDSAIMMIRVLYSIVPAVLCALVFVLSKILKNLIKENKEAV